MAETNTPTEPGDYAVMEGGEALHGRVWLRSDGVLVMSELSTDGSWKWEDHSLGDTKEDHTHPAASYGGPWARFPGTVFPPFPEDVEGPEVAVELTKAEWQAVLTAARNRRTDLSEWQENEDDTRTLNRLTSAIDKIEGTI